MIAYQKYGRHSPFAWLHIPRVLRVAFIFGIAGGEQNFDTEVNEKDKNFEFSGASGKADKLSNAHPAVEAFLKN